MHDIYRYTDARSVQSKTQANHKLALLKHIFRYAQLWGVVEHNPADPVTKLKPRDRNITLPASGYHSKLFRGQYLKE